MNRRAQTWPAWALYAHQAGRLAAEGYPDRMIETRIGAALSLISRGDHRPVERDSLSPRPLLSKPIAFP